MAFGMAVATLVTSAAFATTSDCQKSAEVTLRGDVKMIFCEIPAGNAAIGSENGKYDEKPVIKRYFKSIQIGQYTVTQQQYKAVIGEEPWKDNGELLHNVKEGDNYPAVYITYPLAQQFTQAMNRIDPSATYRLPTEAEFEYAARAGTVTEYYWGNKFDPNYAYYLDNCKGIAEYAREVTSCPSPDLDKKDPGYCANSFGLMHMLGNVWQWTADVYKDSYAGAPTNGNVAVPGDAGAYRVLRGGAWRRNSQSLRSSNRGAGAPDGHYDGPNKYRGHNDVGIRLVRIPK